jgi:hypothetical protein
VAALTGPSASGSSERRICAFCQTPQPLSQLVPCATWLQCADEAGCYQRAKQSGLYPQTESEQSLAQFEAAQGALR